MLNIVIVDDIADNIDVIELLLEEYADNYPSFGGFTVFSSTSPEEAYKIITELDKVDLVFMDIMMPNINGLDLLQLLRHELTIKQPFVVMMTALQENDVRSQAYQNKANGYLKKPISYNEFCIVLSMFRELQKYRS